MIFFRFFPCFLLLVTLYSTEAIAETIFIKDFNLANSKNGQELYNLIKKIHNAASKTNKMISYQGINQLVIEIPQDAESIILPKKVDFAGVNLIVRNNQKDFHLFSRQNPPLVITSDVILSNKKLSNIPQLQNGVKLLIIEDPVPWIKKRHNYRYGAIRKDILLLKNGLPVNNTIASHGLSNYSIVDVTESVKEFKNLSFVRTEDSTHKTFLFKIENENNVYLSNISISTPVSVLYGDAAITINNCTNVFMDSIKINGTYSQIDRYGYGISMNNVWNSKFSNIDATANWGIFGNNNINTVEIRNSNINRFDIHCYGRDVYCYNSTFNNLYNQFSSMFGTLSFEHCTFNKCVPVLLESSYYAYTSFDIVIRDCIFNVDYKRPYLVDAYFINSSQYDVRKELLPPQLPNLYIEGLQIEMPYNRQLYLYGFRGNYLPNFTHDTIVRARNIRINSGEAKAKLLIANKYNNIFEADSVSVEIIDTPNIIND